MFALDRNNKEENKNAGILKFFCIEQIINFINYNKALIIQGQITCLLLLSARSFLFFSYFFPIKIGDILVFSCFQEKKSFVACEF